MLIKCFKNFILCLGVTLIGCGVGTAGNGSSNSSTSQGQAISSSPNVQIGNVATITSANYTAGEYTLVFISNSSDSEISLQNTQIRANGQILSASAISPYVDLGNCLQIGKNKTCSAKILTNLTLQSYLLTLTYSDTSGNSYTTSQIISFNAFLPVQNGFIYDATQLSLVGKSSLSIPFRLADNYTSISVSINDKPAELSCNRNNYNINTLCNAIIKSTDLLVGTNALNQVTITGSGMSGIKSSTLTLSNNQAASIITSGQNVVINPDNGTSPQTVYLFNNGLVNATGIVITPQTPIIISSNTCGTTLAANTGCSFTVNVSGSVASGQSSVGVSYSNGQNTMVLYFNVSYINQFGPALTLTQSGNFNNIAVNTGPIYLSINVSNTGSSNLTNLLFSNLNLQKSNMSSFAADSTCSNGQSLAIGQSCTMVLSYSPTAVETGTINFIPTATYTDPSGLNSLTYTNSQPNIAYSSIASASFIAVGDYGTVISSTNSPPTTWTANIDSPFPSGGAIANGITINNGKYVVMLSTGVVKSSSQNGLFWTTAGATNYSASTCGVVYDTTTSTYYTCGTSNAASAPCSNTGRGCIQSSTTLSGTWARLFQPSQAAAYNNIYFFNNGTTRTCIATFAGALANAGISASLNGAAFVAPTSTG